MTDLIQRPPARSHLPEYALDLTIVQEGYDVSFGYRDDGAFETAMGVVTELLETSSGV